MNVLLLHEPLLVLVLMYGNETILWKMKEKSKVRAVQMQRFPITQMDNLRSLLGIRRMDRVLNAWIRSAE